MAQDDGKVGVVYKTLPYPGSCESLRMRSESLSSRFIQMLTPEVVHDKKNVLEQEERITEIV